MVFFCFEGLSIYFNQRCHSFLQHDQTNKEIVEISISASKLNSHLKSKAIVKMCNKTSFTLMVIIAISMIGNAPDVVVIKIIIISQLLVYLLVYLLIISK